MHINNRFINIDQKHRPHGAYRRANTGGHLIFVVIIITVMITSFTLSNSAHAINSMNDDQKREAITCAPDNLMSPDMVAFTVLHGHGQEFDETDMN